jgi:type VI secretion system protein VasG
MRRSPAFSPTLVKMLSEAWTVASIDYDAGSIRTGFALLVALLGNDDLLRDGARLSARNFR